MEKRVKVTITAEDRIGREESITLMLDKSTAERLEKVADNNTYPDLHSELNNLYDEFKYGYSGGLSPSQFRRLSDFFELIYHKFYNYNLSIEVKY